MGDPKRALETQLGHIEKKTGRTQAQLRAAIAGCGRTKHGEIRSWLMDTYGLGHGDANTLILAMKDAPGAGRQADDVLAEIYADKKAHLRPIHDRVMDALNGLGDFESAPKKGYVSLRRRRQFAMLGPKSNARVELGLNLKDDIASPRLVAQKPGGMCQFVVALTSPEDVDREVVAALKRAFAAAG